MSAGARRTPAWHVQYFGVNVEVLEATVTNELDGLESTARGLVAEWGEVVDH